MVSMNNRSLPFNDAAIITNGGLSNMIASPDATTTSSVLDQYKQKKDDGIQPDTKTVMRSENGRLYVKRYSGSVAIGDSYIMPDIVDVHVYCGDFNQFRAIKVDFADKTTTKAVLSEDDEGFDSIEQGITICVAKKLVDMRMSGAGQSVLNKIVKRGEKVLSQRENEREAEKEEEAMAKARAEKIAKKRRERQVKRAKAEREEKINIRKEAYVRAMRELYPSWMFDAKWPTISADTIALNSQDDLK